MKQLAFDFYQQIKLTMWEEFLDSWKSGDF